MNIFSPINNLFKKAEKHPFISIPIISAVFLAINISIGYAGLKNLADDYNSDPNTTFKQLENTRAPNLAEAVLIDQENQAKLLAANVNIDKLAKIRADKVDATVALAHLNQKAVNDLLVKSRLKLEPSIIADSTKPDVDTRPYVVSALVSETSVQVSQPTIVQVKPVTKAPAEPSRQTSTQHRIQPPVTQPIKTEASRKPIQLSVPASVITSTPASILRPFAPVPPSYTPTKPTLIKKPLAPKSIQPQEILQTHDLPSPPPVQSVSPIQPPVAPPVIPQTSETEFTTHDLPSPPQTISQGRIPGESQQLKDEIQRLEKQVENNRSHGINTSSIDNRLGELKSKLLKKLQSNS